MHHFPLRECGYAVGFIVLLAGLYVGAYYAMVERVSLKPFSSSPCFASYRMSGVWAMQFFNPMHEIDRLLFRPDFWEGDVTRYTIVIDLK